VKKPLHGVKEEILVLSKGDLIGWGTADVKNLIAMANRAVNENLMAHESLPGPQFECLLAQRWFDTLIDKGVTLDVLKELNGRIGKVQYIHVLKSSPNGLPYWRRIANADQIHHPEISIAYGVAQLLAIGALEGLKRCEMHTCRKFFIGRPNTKWCSQSCGSLHRVRQKRKRAKY
jgi:hypothetical protein